MVTHFDISLVGIFHGVGDKVGEHLLYAPLVEHCDAVSIRIVLDEFHAWLLHALGKRLTDVVEHLSEVNLLGFDGQSLSHRRGLEDIVDKSHEHVAVVADDADKFHALLLRINHGQ